MDKARVRITFAVHLMNAWPDIDQILNAKKLKVGTDTRDSV